MSLSDGASALGCQM